MDNKAIYDNSVKENVDSLREDYDNLGIDSLMDEINTKIEGNRELLNYCTNSEGTSGFDASLVVDSHGQLEAVKGILQDETIANEINAINPDFIPEAMSKIEPLVESFKGLEDKYEMFKVEEKPIVEVDTTYKKMDIDTKGYNAKLNFNSLCDLFNVDKSSESINRYGKTSVYEANGKLDRNIEVKMIPVKEGVVSPFAVGRIDIGKNRELLFIGNVASDENGKIIPKLENVSFIGTDGFDNKIPKYLKGEDGRCTEIDLNKSQLKDFVPHGKYTDGKIDVKCSFDDIVKPLINNSGMYTVDNIGRNGEQVTVIDSDFLNVIKDASCLQHNVEIASSEVIKDFSDTIESGTISMDQVYEKSDTVIKLSNDYDKITSVVNDYKSCLDNADKSKDILDRAINHLGNPTVVCNELSLIVPEIFKDRQLIHSATEKLDKFVESYKAVNSETGVSKEAFIQECIGKYVDRYNEALEKNEDIKSSDIKEALSLHIGENGFIYNGAGYDASDLNSRVESTENKNEVRVSSDNEYKDMAESGRIGKGLYSDVEKCDKNSILTDNTRFTKEEIKDLSTCAVGMPQVVNRHCRYLESKGMSKEDIANEVRSVYEKYISSDSDNIITDMKAYVKEVDNIINERKEFDDIEVLPAKVDTKTNTFKDKMHDIYVGATKKMEIESAKMGKLGYGDPLIIGCSMVRAFAGLLSGEIKYTDNTNKEAPVEKHYSVADVTMSLYNILTTSPNALVQSVLYRILLGACENTIDVFIRNTVENLSENIITDDIKKEFLETKVEDGKYVVDNEVEVKEVSVVNEEVINTPVVNNSEANEGDNVIQNDNDDKNTNKVASEESVEESVTTEESEEGVDEVLNEQIETPTNDGENIIDNDDSTNDAEPIANDDGVEDETDEIEQESILDEEDLDAHESVIIKGESGAEETANEDLANEDLSNDDNESIDNEQSDDVVDENVEDTTNDGVSDNVDEVGQDGDTKVNDIASDTQNPLDNEGLTDEMKNQLVTDVNNVIDKNNLSEGNFGEYLLADNKEACNIIEDTLADKLKNAAGTVDEEEVIKNVANLVVRLTNNYDNMSESIESMLGNINKKTNNKEIEDKIISVVDGILKTTPISTDNNDIVETFESDIKTQDEENPENTSFKIDDKEFEKTTFDDGTVVLTMNGNEIDSSLIDEHINTITTEMNGDKDTLGKTEAIVIGETEQKPIDTIMDKILDIIGVSNDDIISCLEEIQKQLPEIIEVAINPQHAIQSLVSDFLNDKIKEYTDVDIKQTINDIKQEVVEGIKDLLTTNNIEIPESTLFTPDNNNLENNVDNSKFDTGTDNNISKDDSIKDSILPEDISNNINDVSIGNVDINNELAEELVDDITKVISGV